MRSQMQTIAVLRLSILEQIRDSMAKVMGDASKVSIGSNGNIILSESILFDVGSSEIKPEASPALDQLVDEMGRGLLQPDPTNATLLRIFGRRIVKVANAQLPNTSNKPEFFIGDFKEFATMFRKEGFEVASTDIGGNAWATDSTEVRGLVRLGVSKFDTAAVAARKLALS